MLVATSCSKNFCIYSERTGFAVVLAQTRRDRELATAQMTVCARALYSMPPDHGSAIVRTIWEDPTLRIDWWNELEKMRLSTVEKRTSLAKRCPKQASRIHSTIWLNRAACSRFSGFPHGD